MPDYDYEPVYPRSNGGKAKMVMALCCLCCGLFFLFGAEGIAWARQASCNMEQGDQGISWNVVIPPKTTTQMQNGFMTSWLWHQVDVYNENATSTPMIGYWSNLDLFFGLLQKYAYVQSDVPTALEAWQPWGFYFGQRYHVWTCSSLFREYYIEEDYWARPWFSLNAQKIFNIREMPSGVLVARSQHQVADVFSLGAHWVATVETLAGDAIATLRQEPPWTWWFLFTYQKWHVENHRPDLLPNEVVSFLAAVYDIDKARERSKKK